MKALFNVILSAAKNLYDYLRDPSLALRVTYLLILTVAASSFWHTNQVQAQSGIDMESTATYVFGQQITFTAQVTSTVQIQQATIVILDETQGVSHVRPVVFTEGRSEFVFDTQQNHIRPFSSISWYYQLTLTDGSAPSPNANETSGKP